MLLLSLLRLSESHCEEWFKSSPVHTRLYNIWPAVTFKPFWIVYWIHVEFHMDCILFPGVTQMHIIEINIQHWRLFTRDENVIIYVCSCHSKPVCFLFFYGTQKRTMCVFKKLEKITFEWIYLLYYLPKRFGTTWV